MLVMNDMRADARVDREAEALALAGHQVSVFALRVAGTPDVESRAGYTVQRVADYTTASWVTPIKKLTQSRARTRAFMAAVADSVPEVIHAHDSDTLRAAGIVAASVGVPMVYDAHELYPDMLQEHGLSGSWPVQAYWKAIERRWVHRADAVITVSEGLASELALRYGGDPIVVANVPRLEPIAIGSRFKRELGLDDAAMVALYQGVLIPGRGLERLVRAWARVPDAVLAIQGFGPVEEEMKREAASAGIEDRVRFMGRVDPSDLHEYASGADLGVVIYEHTTLNNYLAAPNKLYAYLMAGLPIASSDFPGLRAVVEGEGVGDVFDPGSEESIAAAVQRLLADKERLAHMRTHARRLAESRYNWDVEQVGLLEVYERLAGSPRSGGEPS